jgi:hypothetical protein
MYKVENTPAKTIKTVAFLPLAPIIKYAVKAAVSLFASMFNEEFGPQPPTDPEDPGVEVQLCRGASSMSQICH